MQSGRRHSGGPADGTGEDTRRQPEDSVALFRRGIRLLGTQERSEADLRVRLRRYGPPEAVEEAILRLRSLGYVDDRRFSEAFTERRALEEGMGARRVGFELRRHGIDGEWLARAVERAGDAEEAGARQVAERMMRHLDSLTPGARARRLAGALARRGFRADVIVRTLRETAGGTGEDRAGGGTASPDVEALAEALEQSAPEDDGAEGTSGAEDAERPDEGV